MQTVTLTLSEGDVELLEQLIALTGGLCEDLPEIADVIDRLADYESATGNTEHKELRELLEEKYDALLPLRAKDTRLARLRDKLQSASMPERRIA